MIYYPHYTPSKHKLRSILLFSRDINLIVPEVDQVGVQSRSNISDIYREAPEIIKFRDPQTRYDGWALKDGVDRILRKIIEEISNDT